MPRTTFLISDLHIGHRSVISFEPEARSFADIEEHDFTLIDRWNERVNPTDTVWVLGDVVFGRHNVYKIGLMNGYKKLVLGNHDRPPMEENLRPYFAKVYGVATWKKMNAILTHVPVHPGQLTRFSVNLHGHLHSHTLDDPRYINLSVEQLPNLAPIALDELEMRVELDKH